MNVVKIPPYPGFSYLFEQLMFAKHRESIELRMEARRLAEDKEILEQDIRRSNKALMTIIANIMRTMHSRPKLTSVL